MKYRAINIMIAMAILTAFAASAQDEGTEKFALRATAEKSIGNALKIDNAVDGISSSSSSWEYGLDFGMKIWGKNRHSVEANIGLGYGTFSLDANLKAMDYHYAAPAEADMDNETYIRYYNLDGIYQKMKVDRISVPLYVNYRYKFSNVFSLHALFGFRFGFNITSKMKESKASVFSYGVYPQYDNLMIDASYLNEFGSANVGENTSKPDTNKLNSAFLVGLGAEFRIYGPFSIDISARYEGSMNNMLKSSRADIVEFEAINAPVTYTVAEGQRVVSLPSYFSQSKISNFTAAVSLLYRF